MQYKGYVAAVEFDEPAGCGFGWTRRARTSQGRSQEPVGYRALDARVESPEKLLRVAAIPSRGEAYR